MTESDIARQLFACAARAGNSEHKRAHLISLPSLVLQLARDIASGQYQPRPYTVFAVIDPKLREIFAPDFGVRLVQQWLDQFAKHRLKVRGYVRYVDEFVLLADDAATLVRWQGEIEHFLSEALHLQLHPGKTVLQRCTQGINFLGNIVHPEHRLVRQRSVRALRRRLAWFERLIFGHTPHPAPMPGDGHWPQWLQRHEPLSAPGHPSPALLKRMLSTLNSYYGVFSHADTFGLRRHIYERELGRLQTFFIPEGPGYRYLRIRKAWLPGR